MSIIIVGGPPGAGKSSVCESLSERYDRTVHLQTDDVFAWIRMGFLRPWNAAARQQNEMVSRACARAAVPFAREQYGVFIDGVIGPWMLDIYLAELREAQSPVHYAVLLPAPDEMMSRARAREKQIAGADDEMFQRMHAQFAEAVRSRYWTLDSTGLDTEQAADLIMAAAGRGETLIWSPRD